MWYQKFQFAALRLHFGHRPPTAFRDLLRRQFAWGSTLHREIEGSEIPDQPPID